MNIPLLVHQARRWILYAVLPAILVAALGFVYTAREPKTYQTTTVLYVQVPASDAAVPGTTDVSASQAVIPTYSQMITAPVTAQAVNRVLVARYPGYRLSTHNLTVGGSNPLAAQQQTQLMTIAVTDTNPVRAAAAANETARTFIGEITAIQKARFKGGAESLQQQINQAQANIQDVSRRIASYRGGHGGLSNLKAQLTAFQSIDETLLLAQQQFNVGKSTALNSVKVFSPAQVPTVPIGPHPARTALLAAFVALLACAGGIFAYDYFDDTPRSPEEIEEIVGAPILGTVQQFNAGKSGTSLVAAENSPFAEAYRMIRTNIQFTDVDNPPRTIVVTSPSPGEGKSTTAANLAHVLAESGRKVTLVDADLRRPSLHRVFNRAPQDGLTNLLMSTEQLNGHGTQPTTLPALRLLAAGPVPPRPADLLGSRRMTDLVGHLRAQNDMVVIDSPPLLAVTDAAILATITDGIVMVVDPACSKRRDLVRARDAVEVVGGRVLGIVVNRLRNRAPGYHYYRRDYGHAHDDESARHVTKRARARASR